MRISHFLATLLAAANLASAQLVVSHQSASTASPTNQPKPYLKIENQGATAVDLSKITLDYLIYESGLLPTALVADCWYVSSGVCTDLTAEFASIPLQDDGTRKANLRIRIGFVKGTLSPGQNLTLQWGYHEQAFQRQFIETDDWSFTQANSQWNVDSRIAVGSNGTPTTGTTMVWKGLVPGLPATGKAGDVVHSQAQNASFVYDGTSWVLVSEVGKDGPQGPVGPAGVAGAKGDKGDAGAAGAQGLQGVAGPAGAAGAAGAPGATGATGAIGPKGDKGDAGTGTGDNSALLQIVADLTARMIKLEQAENPNVLVDARDGKVYKTVQIGTQTWMAENLNYGGETGEVGSCYAGDVANCSKFGRLYDWTTAMEVPPSFASTLWGGSDVKHQGVCPAGWHIPNQAEWAGLTSLVRQAVGYGQDGYALKATFSWLPTGTVSGNGSDQFGFRGLGAGSVASRSLGEETSWISATEGNATNGREHSLYNDANAQGQQFLYDGSGPKSLLTSCRCLKD